MKRYFIVHPFILSDICHFVFYLFKDIILVTLIYSFHIAIQVLLDPVFACSLMIMVDVVMSELSSFMCFILAVLFGLILVSSPVVECGSRIASM